MYAHQGLQRKPRHRVKNRALNQMVAAFDGTSLRDETKNQAASGQPANGVRKRARKERKRKQLAKKTLTQLTATLEEGSSLTGQESVSRQQEGTTNPNGGMHEDLLLQNDKQKDTRRTTRSMNGKLPLAFDSSYLLKMGEPSFFTHTDDIRTWIDSVSHHLKSWYCECLRNPMHFLNAISQNEPTPYRFVRELGGPQEGAQEEDLANNFVQHTWTFVGRIARDGHRGGAFSHSKKERHIRYAAIMLLISVIMDLTVNMGYFIRLFLGIVDAPLTAEDQQILLALGGASASTAQPFQHPRGASAVPRTLQVPADLFCAVSGTFGGLPQSTGCRVLVHPPSGPGFARYIVLIGSADQMDGAEQVITKAIQTSFTPSGMDMS